MNHFFLFTLGPVQTFIAQARKTQDLYAGSQLLSDLCRVGIQAIKQYQGKIIFPSDNEKNKSLPNRFLAEVPEQPDMLAIGKDIEDKVRSHFKTKAEGILKQYSSSKPEGFDEQIENHLDIHWIFHPIESSYAEAYQEIEKLLGAIKNIRAFKQLNGGYGECGRKCSLDGERNALFYRCKKNQPNPESCPKEQRPTFIQDNAIELKKGKSKLNPNEALSAVSFVKRFYLPEEFSSTTTVALMDYLEQLETTAKSNQEAKSTINELLKKFTEEGKYKKKSLRELETGIFYEENLTSKYFDEHDLEKYKEYIPDIRKIVTTLDKFAKKTKYYAVLVFDGDNMGKWLSGEWIKDKTQLHEFHDELSKRLGEFAKTAAKQLVYPCGQTVYAGGDDFLGFVNLNYLFEVMMSLRQLFDCLVNQKLKRFYSNPEKPLTFSAGVLIAHYKMPLHIVLQEARRLEKVAKEEGGRNAFAMGVMKHSGESHQICYKWQDGEEWNVERIRFIIEELQENFSDTFIRNLNLELSALVEEDESDQYRDIKNDDRLIPEIKRLIIRSVQKEKMDDQEVKLLNDRILALWKSGKKSSHDKPKNFLDMLNVASFITKK